MQNEQDELEKIIQLFVAQGKTIIAAGNTLQPEGFLFYQENESYGIMRISTLTADWKNLKQSVQRFYDIEKGKATRADKPFVLKGVITLCDAYVEDLDEVEFVGGRRTSPFAPKIGQREAMLLVVYYPNGQWAHEYRYVREKGYAAFQPGKRIRTIDHPGARMANLWPANV
jgi:hypothetical protein